MAMMKDNFKSLVDVEKLRKSNDICKKWADRFHVEKNDYISFIINLKKNPEPFKNQLEVRFRSQFVKDLKSMFYAFEVENTIIEQFYYTIPHIMKKIKPDDQIKDELFSVGLIALRSAVLNYRSHKSKASLCTFCYNGVFQKMLGTIHKNRLKDSRKKVFFFNESDIISGNKKNISLDHLAKQSFDYDINFQNEEAQQCLNEILNNSDLDDDETFLIQRYMRRNIDALNWNAEFRDRFEKIYSKKISKQGVFCKLAKAQRKMWSTYSRLKKLPLFDKTNKFQTAIIK